MAALKWGAIGLLVALAGGCAPESDLSRAEALARSELGNDISPLTAIEDGRAFCGFTARGASFIVEGGEVTLLGSEPENYRRCGHEFVEPWPYVVE